MDEEYYQNKIVSLQTENLSLRESLREVFWEFIPKITTYFSAIPMLSADINENSGALNGYDKSPTILGQGKFGKVIKAKKNGKEYAIKIISKKNIYKLSQLKRLDNEIRILEKINHKNLITFCEAIQSEHYMWLVMFFGGDTLYDWWLDRGQTVSIQFFRMTMSSVANALDYLNKMSIAHCDIKMANLLIMPNTPNIEDSPMIKICDFGFACNYGDNPNHAISDFCGSRGYFAPELITEPEWDPSIADMWSLGCIAMQMIMGEDDFCKYWVSKYKKESYDYPEDFFNSLFRNHDFIRNHFSVFISKGKLKESKTISLTDIEGLSNFVFYMLEFDVSVRMSPTQCQNHSFLVPPSPLHSSDNTKSYKRNKTPTVKNNNVLTSFKRNETPNPVLNSNGRTETPTGDILERIQLSFRHSRKMLSSVIDNMSTPHRTQSRLVSVSPTNLNPHPPSQSKGKK